MITDIFQQLIRDEALRTKPYKDSVGKLTIGVGRNLDDVGISQDEAIYLLTNDVTRTRQHLSLALPWTDKLPEERKAVLINMAFNMGVDGLCRFKRTLALIAAGDYRGAAREMLDSTWAKQVGARAQRLSIQMATGVWQ